MKKLLLALSLSPVIGIALMAGCAGSENITSQEAFTLLQNNQDNPNFVVLDVRTPEEFADGHIENAINIDYRSDTFRDELDNLDKSKTYLVYCRSGGRSANAMSIMAELNFKEAYNILGGIINWKAEGLPTTEPEHANPGEDFRLVAPGTACFGSPG